MFSHTRLILCFVCTVLCVLFCIYLPYMVKKMGTQCVIPFPFVPQDPFFAARFFSLIRFLPGATKVHCAAPCLPFSPSHIFHFLPFFLPILLLLLLLSFFPFASPTSLLLSPSPPSKNPGRNKINASHFGGASGPASVFKKFFQKKRGGWGALPPSTKRGGLSRLFTLREGKKEPFHMTRGEKSVHAS